MSGYKQLWRSINVWRFTSIILVALLITVFGYEFRILERISHQVQLGGKDSELFMSGEFSQEGFEMVAAQTKKDLFAFKPILKSRSNISRTETLVRQYISSRHVRFHFSHALLLIGLLESHSNKDADVAFQSIKDWCDKIIDTEGQLRIPIRYIDDCMIGYAFCELYDRTHSDRYRRAADQLANYLLQQYPRSPTGTLPYYREHPEITGIDDKGEICAFLVRYGEQFGVPKATDLGVRQLLEFLRFGIDTESGLPWQACRPSDSLKMVLLGWLRGIGWLSIGLADTLKYLPKDHLHYKEINEEFLALLSAVRIYQENQKCWNWEIRNTIAHEDTSGTAMIGYAIESAIASGIVDKYWSAMSENALIAVLRHTHRNGVVDDSLADCMGVGLFANYFGPSNFAQGPATALYSLILRRIQSERSSVSAENGKSDE